MNSITLIGTLTKDPEMKGEGDGRVCQMRIAESNADPDKPLFVTVAAFGRNAENCERYLAKGRHVAVSGRLRFREWSRLDGAKHSEHSIAADRVDFLPGGARVEREAPEPAPA